MPTEMWGRSSRRPHKSPCWWSTNSKAHSLSASRPDYLLQFLRRCHGAVCILPSPYIQSGKWTVRRVSGSHFWGGGVYLNNLYLAFALLSYPTPWKWERLRCWQQVADLHPPQKFLEVSCQGKSPNSWLWSRGFPLEWCWVLGGCEVSGVGGLTQPGWVNGHGPCGIWPFGRGSPSPAALRAF